MGFVSFTWVSVIVQAAMVMQHLQASWDTQSGESQRLPCWRSCMEVLWSVVSAELPASTPGLADSHANCHFGCLDHLYFQMTTAWYLTTRAWETPVRTTQPSPSQILHQKCMSNIKWLLFYKAKFCSHLHSAVETRSPPSFSLIQGSHK